MKSPILRIALIAGFLVGSMGAQAQTDYHGRKAWALENEKISLVITPGGGHIASATLKKGSGAGLNPLWLPPWKSVEPGGWQSDPAGYGGKPAAQLLCCILGHNLCLDFFGAPSDAETKAGIAVHGEAPCVNWKLDSRTANSVTYSTALPMAQMRVTRTVKLTPNTSGVWITETVENLSPFDRPFGWQQHVTLGSPFLTAGESFFDMNGGWSTTAPKAFSDQQRLKKGAEFEWPNAPGAKGDDVNLRGYPGKGANSDFTVSEIDPNSQWAWFTAVNVKKGLLIGYVWPRKVWPWAANWEENHSRSGKPWLRKATARGIEFGTSPFPYSRKDAIELHRLHDTPTYRWIDAKGRQTVSYGAFLASIPPGTTGVKNLTLSASGVAIDLAGSNVQVKVGIKR